MVYQKELVQQVAREANYHDTVVAKVIDGFVKAIQAQLVDDEPVLLPGFGTFYTRWQPAGRVRHIQTGAMITVPERRVVGFRVADATKKLVKRG